MCDDIPSVIREHEKMGLTREDSEVIACGPLFVGLEPFEFKVTAGAAISLDLSDDRLDAAVWAGQGYGTYLSHRLKEWTKPALRTAELLAFRFAIESKKRQRG